jgi:hypothetical protein
MYADLRSPVDREDPFISLPSLGFSSGATLLVVKNSSVGGLGVMHSAKAFV